MESTPEGNVVLALFQGHSRDWDTGYNLSRMKEQISRASVLGADMIIFPELFLSGCHKLISSEKVATVAEEKDGPSFQELSKAAKEAHLAVLYGYPEMDRSSGTLVLHNSAQLIDKDGRSLANYRKTHLWIGEDRKVFTPGNNFTPIVECCGVKVGILICFDIEFPECVRTLVLRGAELIAVPTAVEGAGDGREFLKILPPARAMENCVFVINVNQADQDFCGLSSCCYPNGDFAVLGGSDEALLLTTIERNFEPKYNFLNYRRAELYGEVVTQGSMNRK